MDSYPTLTRVEYAVKMLCDELVYVVYLILLILPHFLALVRRKIFG